MTLSMVTTGRLIKRSKLLYPTRPALLLIDVQPRRTKSANELPALAFGSHYSVFKERPGTHQYCRCWCRVARRTVPDGRVRWKVSFGCRTTLGGRSDGIVTVAGASHSVNALSGREHRGATPGCDLSADRSGTSAVTDGCPHERPGSLQAQASRRHQWWHAGGHPAFRMPPGARCATSFPLPSLPPIRV